MADILSKRHPLSDNDVEALEDVLKDLQGNILSGHGRNRVYLLLIKFKNNASDVHEVKKWIHELTEHELITSAYKQREDSQRFRAAKERGHIRARESILVRRDVPAREDIFRSFFLSAEGYRRLGLTPPGFDVGFHQGMAKMSVYLHDTPHLGKYRQNDIHAMLLLADTDAVDMTTGNRLGDRLKRDLDQHRARIDSFTTTFEEYGEWENGERKEHFGYRDGISQPLFFKRQVDDEQQKIETGNIGYAPYIVLEKDPYGDGYGSYLVFRKLEQHIEHFRDNIKTLAAKLAEASGISRTNDHEERAYALVMGRHKDGRPIVHPKSSRKPRNDFDFQEIPGEETCPVHAHIRKMNPRTSDKLEPIVRRGIPYTDPTREKKGLLFMCYQASIDGQFVPLQTIYADNQKTLDPIIGREMDGFKGQDWPTPPDSASRDKPVSFPFTGSVTLVGGEYFFAPSISFLGRLHTI